MALVAGQVPLSGYQIPDYTRVGQIAAQGEMTPSQMFGSFLEDLDKKKKESSQLNAQARVAENYLKSAKTFLGGSIPGLSENIDQLLAMANDPKVSPYEKSMILASGQQSLGDLTNIFLQREKIGMMQQAQAQSMSRTGENQDNDWNAGLTAPQ